MILVFHYFTYLPSHPQHLSPPIPHLVHPTPFIHLPTYPLHLHYSTGLILLTTLMNFPKNIPTLHISLLPSIIFAFPSLSSSFSLPDTTPHNPILPFYYPAPEILQAGPQTLQAGPQIFSACGQPFLKINFLESWSNHRGYLKFYGEKDFPIFQQPNTYHTQFFMLINILTTTKPCL